MPAAQLLKFCCPGWDNQGNQSEVCFGYCLEGSDQKGAGVGGQKPRTFKPLEPRLNVLSNLT